MAIVNEEFMRCETCGNADFRKEKIVTLPKGLQKRQDFEKVFELQAIETKFIYRCTQCNTPVD